MYIYIYIWPCLLCICMGILAMMPTTERFFKLTTWDPDPYAGDPGAALGLARACPWAQALATSFVVPGDPEAAPGSPAYEYESQVANLQNLSVVDLTGRITQVNKIDMAI